MQEPSGQRRARQHELENGLGLGRRILNARPDQGPQNIRDHLGQGVCHPLNQMGGVGQRLDEMEGQDFSRTPISAPRRALPQPICLKKRQTPLRVVLQLGPF